MWRECARQCCGQETCCINQDIEAICRQAAILESGGPKGVGYDRDGARICGIGASYRIPAEPGPQL